MMTASDQNSRRSEKAEFSRSVTATETLAFMTALVAFLKEADARAHHGSVDVRPPPADAHATAAHAVDPTPVDATPGQHPSVSGEQHADAAPPSEQAPATVHADAAVSGDDVHVGGTTNVKAAGGSIGLTTATDPHAVAAIDHGSSPNDNSAHATTTISAAPEPAALHDLGSTITNLVDSSLAAVSHTLDSLSTTVTELTSTVTGTISDLTGSVSGLVGGILHSVTGAAHDAPGHDLVDALVTDIVSSPLTPPHDDAASHHVDISGLDTAGAVPMAALPPLALHLGFLGQPTPDGHDLHDGAFSALGVHHF